MSKDKEINDNTVLAEGITLVEYSENQTYSHYLTEFTQVQYVMSQIEKTRARLVNLVIENA